jgi:ParB-like nuclease domain
MIDIRKAEGSDAEVDPLREMAPTQTGVASSCAAEIRQSNNTGSDLGGIVHGGDVNAAASCRVQQIEQIDDEIRRAVEPGAMEYVPVGDLKPNPHNARKHPESQIDLLAASIRQFGFVGAIIVDEENVIISGHGRRAAAKRIGMEVVPCIRVQSLWPKKHPRPRPKARTASLDANVQPCRLIYPRRDLRWTRSCTHKSRLVSSGWSNVRFAPKSGHSSVR